MTNSSIRLARSEDVRQIEHIAMEAYAPYLERMDCKPFPMRDDYAAHIADGHIYLVEKSSEIAGYVVLLPTKKGLLLDNIGVSTRFQGQGFGAFLVRFAESYDLSAGLGAVWLYTNEIMTENLAWYAKLGYRESHREIEKGYKRVYFEKKLPPNIQ